MATPNENENENSVVDSVLQRRSSTCVTFFGKIRHVGNISYHEWIFLTVAITSALISIGITIERMISRFDSDTQDFTFALLLCANIVFCIYYVIRGIFQERPYEIFVFVVTNFIVLIYLIVNATDGLGNLKKIRLGCGCFFGIINIGNGLYFCYKYKTTNNLVFRIVGALPEMQRICSIFFVCEGFLIFDFQLQISLLILALKRGVDVSELPMIILIVGTILAIPWCFIGYLALRRESKLLCHFFWGTSWISPAYVIYKFVYTATFMTSADILYEVIFVTGVFAVLTRIALITSSVFAYFNFDKGFKEKTSSLLEKSNINTSRDSYIHFPSPDTEYSSIRLK